MRWGRFLQSGENLASMVDVIPESASVETGAVALHREEIILAEFLEEMRRSCEGLVQKPNVSLVWDYPLPLPVGRDDPGNW